MVLSTDNESVRSRRGSLSCTPAPRGSHRSPAVDTTSNWLSRTRQSGRRITPGRPRQSTLHSQPRTETRRLHASFSARRPIATSQRRRRRNASLSTADAADGTETEPDATLYLTGLANKTWRMHNMSPMFRFSDEPARLRRCARVLAAHVQSSCAKDCISVEETSNLASVKPLKLTTTPDGSRSLTGLQVQLLQRPRQRGGSPTVVLTAVMLTATEPDEVSMTDSVTHDVVDPRCKWLPLVLVKGPVKLRSILVDWWQCEYDCRITPMTLSPIELSWMVGMFSGVIPEGASSVKDVELVYGLPSEVTGLSKISYQINAFDCQRLWRSIHSSSSSSGREGTEISSADVVTFIDAIEQHFVNLFRIRLSACHLLRVGTATVYATNDGGLKMHSVDNVLQILSHLEFVSRNQFDYQ